MEQSIQAAVTTAGSGTSNPLEMLQALTDIKAIGKKGNDAGTVDGEDCLAPFLQILNQQMALLLTNGGDDVQQMMGLNEKMQTMLLPDGELPTAGSDSLLEFKSLLAKLFPAAELNDLGWNALPSGGGNASDVLKPNDLLINLPDEKAATTDETGEQLKSTIMAMVGGIEASVSMSKEGQKSSDAVSDTTKKSTVTELRPDLNDKSFIKEATVNMTSDGKKETLTADVLKFDQVVTSLKEDQQNIKFPEVRANQQNNPAEIVLTDIIGKKEATALSRQDNPSQNNIVMSEVQSAVDVVKKVLIDGENKMNISESKDAILSRDTTNNKTENSLFGKDVKSATLIRENSEPAQKPWVVEPPKTELAKVNTAETILNGVGEKVKTDFKVKITSVEKSPEGPVITTVANNNISTAKAYSIEQTSPAEIINRIASEFKENILSDGGRVKITLTPPSLGTLEMDVVVRNGKVEVTLIADNKDVQKMLAGNLEQLKGSLQTQGLTIERCDVMMQDRREQYPQGFSQQTFNQEQSAKHHDDQGEPYNQDAPNSEPMKVNLGNHTTWDSGKISLFA